MFSTIKSQRILKNKGNQDIWNITCELLLICHSIDMLAIHNSVFLIITIPAEQILPHRRGRKHSKGAERSN